ncbi:MAG: putative porin [Candidatus Schekmanbacteria bacterium]|nr:putative porin [Candidatus Schekmanbacteria bacterium]
MKRFRLFTLFFAFLFFTTLSFASEVEILVKKLVQKGILTEEEAKEMLSETKAEESKQKEAQKETVKEEVKTEMAKTQEVLKNTILPTWVKNTTFSGDVRLRYAYDRMKDDIAGEDTNFADRQRLRFRLRYGFETVVNDKVKVGLRFATGTGDQTSTNQTMQDTFSAKNIWLDQAFIEIKPIPELRLIGGKIENPFYTTDLVWDPDVKPEGIVVQAKKSFGEKELNIEPFMTFGFFPIDESSTDSNDQSLYGLQGGASAALFGTKLKFAAGYYDFHNIKGAAIEDVSPANIRKSNTFIEGDDDKNLFAYDYRLFTLGGEFTPIEFDAFGTIIPVTLYGDFVKNLVSDVDFDTGYLGGIKIGAIKNAGDFQVAYDYRKLEKDAVYAPIADSDFHAGGTNAKGSKFSATYAVLKNTTLGIVYFDTKAVTKAAANQSDLRVKTLFLETVVKF